MNKFDHAESVRNSQVASFTLIEMMLVVFIIGILAAAVTPYLAKSIRGNRLRTAARSVVTAGRYARSIAVMRQTDVYLTFDINAGAISVIESAPQRQAQPGAADYAAAIRENKPKPEDKPDVAAEEPKPEDSAVVGGTASLVRKLDGITIASVETDSGDAFMDGTHQVVYHRNGRCTPFTVKLTDEGKNTMTVMVDALASAKVEER